MGYKARRTFKTMNKTPSVSVVMSNYNGSKYLSEAVNSILRQSYRDFEFIIIDDASTDGSIKIIETFQDERIVFIQNPYNYGLAKSLNIGFSIAKGKYIVRMDSDDISKLERLSLQVKFMENNDKVIVCGCMIEYFSENVGLLKKFSTKWIKVNNVNIKHQLVYGSCFAHPSVIIRKSALDMLENVYDETLLRSQDYDLWWRLAELGDFSNIEDVLLAYRVTPNMASIKHSVNQAENMKLIIDKYTNNTSENDVVSLFCQIKRDFEGGLVSFKSIKHLFKAFSNNNYPKLVLVSYLRAIKKKYYAVKS